MNVSLCAWFYQVLYVYSLYHLVCIVHSLVRSLVGWFLQVSGLLPMR